MMYVDQDAISFSDVAIVTQYSEIDSRQSVDLSAPNHAYPFIASPMYHLATKDMAKFFLERDMPFVLHRYFKNANEQMEFFAEIQNFMPTENNPLFVAVGSDEKWIGQCVLKGAKKFCVDMAHGNSAQAVKAVKFIKQYCEDAIIMAGNIETYDGFRRLYDAGARYFRVGIGSGSICSTNINTGYGLPILTALEMIKCKMTDEECKESWLIADGGIRTAGDVAKALAFGADYVMCGKVFASTSLARGPFFDQKGNPYKLFNNYTTKWIRHDGGEDNNPSFAEYAGMASKLMREMAGGSQKTNVSEEGQAGLVKYAGQTEDVFNAICENLKAVLAYSGCSTIPEFKADAIVRRVAAGGKLEKQVHLDRIF
jgi:IMP dehydrogenase